MHSAEWIFRSLSLSIHTIFFCFFFFYFSSYFFARVFCIVFNGVCAHARTHVCTQDQQTHYHSGSCVWFRQFFFLNVHMFHLCSIQLNFMCTFLIGSILSTIPTTVDIEHIYRRWFMFIQDTHTPKNIHILTLSL